MTADKIIDTIFKVKVLLNNIADGVPRPQTTLYVPKGTKCEGCPGLYSTQNDDDTCGLAAIWGESGMGSVTLEDGKKSRACLEETQRSGASVTSTPGHGA